MFYLLGAHASTIQIIITVLSSAFVVFCTMPIHEFAHAFAANKLGDPTARYQGRLTLNPLAHIDYIGALLILFLGFGWAKPVPVNQRNFRNPKRDMAITGAAGPLSNLIMATILLFFANALLVLPVSGTVATLVSYFCDFLSFAAQLNIFLAIFNLIPVPPLDGSRILFAFLPDRLYYKIQMYERQIYFIIMILIAMTLFSKSNFLNPLSIGSGYVYNWINTLVSLPFGGLLHSSLAI